MEEVTSTLRFGSVNDDENSRISETENVIGVDNQGNMDEDVGVKRLRSNDIECQESARDDIIDIGVERNGDLDIVEVPINEIFI